MKTGLLVVLAAAVVLGLGGTLALINDACKTSRGAWCAPGSHVPHHVRTVYR